jgi:general secretion pathway protein H
VLPKIRATRINRGFTLIELSVVLFVMALAFGAIGISLSSGNDATTIKSAARDMISALRYARGQALMLGDETTVTIDFAENTYQISTRNKIYHIPKKIHVTLVTAQSEFSGEGQANIRFFGDGSSTGGRVTLELDQWVWRININWLTGLIDLADA